MTLRAEIKTITAHLDYFDQQNILAVIDRYTKKGSSEVAIKNKALGWARNSFKTARVVYLYQSDYDTVRVRISQRLFDKNSEIYLGRATNMEEVEAILCNSK